MTPYFSIVLPVFNVRNYLEECYESLCVQTFEHWEAIFVDDGSTDGSAEYLDGLQLSDRRIRVVHQRNLGVSVARNVGIEMARGEWVAFVDPDDFVNPRHYEEYFEICSRHPEWSIVGGPVRNVDERGRVLRPLPDMMPAPRLYSGDVLLKLFDSRDHWYLYTVWSKVFRRSFLNHEKLHFVPGAAVEEDYCFNVQALSRVNTFYAFSSSSIYCYRIHPGQVMKHITVERALGRTLVLRRIVRDANSMPYLRGLQLETTGKIISTLAGGLSYGVADRWRYVRGLVRDADMRGIILPYLAKCPKRIWRQLSKALMMLPCFWGALVLFWVITLLGLVVKKKQTA